MARWTRNLELSSENSVGHTIIAGWWPTTYYRVLTMEIKVASATEGVAFLTHQLQQKCPDKCGLARDYFVALVHRTDRYGFPKTNGPVYEVEFQYRDEAILGHRQIVQALGQSERSLSCLLSTLEATEALPRGLSNSFATKDPPNFPQ